MDVHIYMWCTSNIRSDDVYGMLLEQVSNKLRAAAGWSITVHVVAAQS